MTSTTEPGAAQEETDVSDIAKDWVSRCGDLASKIGIPAVALGVVIYIGGWKIAPPLVESHVGLLRKVTETQGGMANTQKQMADTLTSMGKTQEQMANTQEAMTRTLDTMATAVEEIRDVESRTSEFMDAVQDEHRRAESKLDKLLDQNG